MPLIPKRKVLCPNCGGILVMQRKGRFEVMMKDRFTADGKPVKAYRITEVWRCHNGHLHLVNYNEEAPLTIRTSDA